MVPWRALSRLPPNLSGTHAESMLIGAIGGVLVVLSLIGLDKAKIDDPVGAISVHGTCGIWGLLAVLITSEDATLQGQLTGLGAFWDSPLWPPWSSGSYQDGDGNSSFRRRRACWTGFIRGRYQRIPRIRHLVESESAVRSLVWPRPA